MKPQPTQLYMIVVIRWAREEAVQEQLISGHSEHARRVSACPAPALHMLPSACSSNGRRWWPSPQPLHTWTDQAVASLRSGDLFSQFQRTFVVATGWLPC